MSDHICGCGGIGRSFLLSLENCCSVMTSPRGRALAGLCTAPYMDSYITWAVSSSEITIGRGISYITVKCKKQKNTHAVACVCRLCCRKRLKVLIEQREVRLHSRTALFLVRAKSRCDGAQGKQQPYARKGYLWPDMKTRLYLSL